MKFFAALILLISATCQAAVTERFLDAVSWVESSNRDTAIGARGEIGRFQMTRAAKSDVDRVVREWQASQLTFVPPAFSSLTNRTRATFYTRTYCWILESQLRRALKREPSAAEIYAAYNLGFRGFERRRFRISNCPSVTRNAVKLLESKI